MTRIGRGFESRVAWTGFVDAVGVRKAGVLAVCIFLEAVDVCVYVGILGGSSMEGKRGEVGLDSHVMAVNNLPVYSLFFLSLLLDITCGACVCAPQQLLTPHCRRSPIAP